MDHMIHVLHGIFEGYEMRTDHVNGTLKVFGPAEELYALAIWARDKALFTGIVYREADGVVIRVVLGFSPARE